MKHAPPALGRSGLLALATLGLTLVYYLSYLHPLAAGNDQLRQRAAARRLATETHPPARPDDNNHRIGKLPGDKQRALDLVRLVSVADKFGLRIAQRSYEEQHKTDKDPIRLTGRLKIEASYPSVRAWLEEVTTTMPALSVTTLHFERPEDAGRFLKINLEFLYLSTSADHAAPPLSDATTIPNARLEKYIDPFAMPVIRTKTAPISLPKVAEVSFPFDYGGRYVTVGSEVVLLIEGDEVHRVRPGERVAGTAFRLDTADRDELQFTNLNTNRRLSLPIGSPP